MIASRLAIQSWILLYHIHQAGESGISMEDLLNIENVPHFTTVSTCMKDLERHNYITKIKCKNRIIRLVSNISQYAILPPPNFDRVGIRDATKRKLVIALLYYIGTENNFPKTSFDIGKYLNINTRNIYAPYSVLWELVKSGIVECNYIYKSSNHNVVFSLSDKSSSAEKNITTECSA